MMKSKIITLIGAAAILSGCASSSKGPLPVTNKFYEGSVLLIKEDCPVTGSIYKPTPPSSDNGNKEFVGAGLAATAVAAVIPTIADKLIDAGAKYLKERKEKLTNSFTNKTHFTWQKGGAASCLVMARGKFGPVTQESKAKKMDLGVQTNTTLADLIGLVGLTDERIAAGYKSIGLAGAPYFYLEAWIYTPDKTAEHVALLPNFFEYSKTSADRIKNNKKDILLTVDLTTASKKEKVAEKGEANPKPEDTAKKNESPAPSGLFISLPNTLLGSRYYPEVMTNFKTEAIPTNTLSGETLVNIQATVLETQEGGDLALAASEVISENKDKLSKTLQEALKEVLNIKDVNE